MNKKLLKDLETALINQSEHKGFIKYGTCNLHIVHNSFGDGLKVVSQWNIEDFLTKLFYYFHKYPARKEDLREVQELLELQKQTLLRYVSNRWLTIVPVINRVISQFEALKKYFTDIASKNKQAAENEMYKSIKKFLLNPLSLCRLHFLKSVGEMHNSFLTLMQKDVPLVHVLHCELHKLMKNIFSRFVKPEALEFSISSFDLSNQDNLMKHVDIDIGYQTSEELRKQVVLPKDRSSFFHDCKDFYKRIAKYLQSRLPIDNDFLQSLECLNPSLQDKQMSLEQLKRAAQMMPCVIDPSNIDKLCSEWRVYINMDFSGLEFSRVDGYWSQVLQTKSNVEEGLIFNILPVFVHAALSLSHGQAFVERGFSINKNIATVGRPSLKAITVKSLRIVEDEISSQGGVMSVEISRSLLTAYRGSRAKYADYLKAQEEFDRAAVKDKPDTQEGLTYEEMAKRERKLHDDIIKGKNTVQEGTDCLAKVTTMSADDMKWEVKVCSTIIETGNHMITEAEKELSALSK